MTEVNTMKGKNTIFVFRYIHSCLFIARLKIQVEFKITETGKNVACVAYFKVHT